MKLNISFPELEQLVIKMGASQIEWQSDIKNTESDIDWKIKLETVGIDVNVEDIEIMDNGLLCWNGEQILLHIKEVNGFYSLPKFHFYDCSTLKTMKAAGRFERYVVTQRKDGTFLVDKKIGYNEYSKNEIVTLSVCGNCLNWYNRRYRKRYTINDFNISDFFENFSNTPINQKPMYTDLTAQQSGYPPDWDTISLRMREKANWHCQQCFKDCSQTKTGLEVHHIDGVKAHIYESNLKVLCRDCHSLQPHHGHLKSR